MSYYPDNIILPPMGALALEYKEDLHRPPGDGITNESYSFPLIRETVKGATTWKVVIENEMTDEALEPYVAACKALQDKGCVGVLTSCGFLAQIQSRLSSKVDIPIMTSALLQIPHLFNIISPKAKIGVLTFDPTVLGRPHFHGVGITDAQIERLIITGSKLGKPLYELVVGGSSYDHDLIEAEMVQLALEIVEKNRDIKVLVLECTQMPPFAKAIQNVVKLPVYDVNTLAEWFYSGLYRGIFPEDKNPDYGKLVRCRVNKE